MSLREHIRKIGDLELRKLLLDAAAAHVSRGRRSAVVLYDPAEGGPGRPPGVPVVLFIPDNKRARE
jgi:hypothetical protein